MATYTNRKLCEIFGQICAKKITRGGQLWNSNHTMFIEGRAIYSYGYHYKLAEWCEDGTIWLNDFWYSPTTSKQRSYVVGGLVKAGVALR